MQTAHLETGARFFLHKQQQGAETTRGKKRFDDRIARVLNRNRVVCELLPEKRFCDNSHTTHIRVERIESRSAKPTSALVLYGTFLF
jgi:hypothetical protein